MKDMKRIYPLLAGVAMVLPVHAQWAEDRHPLYDVCSPTEAEQVAAATQLSLVPMGEYKLTYPVNAEQVVPSAFRKMEALSAWRGERCNTQLAIIANGSARQLRVVCEGLSNGSCIIPVQTSMIRYTKAHGVPTADIIGKEQVSQVFRDEARGVWLQIDVPQDAAPGTYRGTVTVRAEGGLETSQEVVLSVSEEQLASPDQWKFHLDLWQHPQAVARWHDVEPWSPEHFALLRPMMKRLADAGQKCITCTLLDEAWNGQTYDTFPSMVKWIRGRDGKMRYDYTALDAWIRFMHDDIGIREQISCYTMIPWHLSVQYYDEATGEYASMKATPGTEEYAAIWASFLQDFYRHMQDMGWAEKTCIAIDERPDPYVRAAMKLVQDYAPGFRIASAVDKPSELTGEVYNISPVLTHAGTALGELLRQRQQAGKLTTFYVCLHPKKPNSFTHSEPAEAEWLGLFAAANRLDGFLRWAYNSWSLNPFKTTDFGKWPSGDCFLVYPGNLSSVRFERLRDGIEDYEKIRALRARASESPEAAQVIAAMDAALSSIFTVERSTGDTHVKDVQNARYIIEQTAAALRSCSRE